MSGDALTGQSAERGQQKADPVLDGLANAADAQVARIVAMVDAMPNRGNADALIAPLRPRLAQIQPARRMIFTRLLFNPLNGLILPPRQWRRGRDIGIPRTTLAPMASALRGALPALAADVDHALKTALPGDTTLLQRLGGQLWPAAAAAIDEMAMPEGWAEAADLMYNDYLGVARTIAAVLHEASAIERLATGIRVTADDAVSAVLARSLQRGPVAFAAVLAVLLARLPNPDRVMAVAAELGRGDSPEIAEQVAAHALSRLQDRMGFVTAAKTADATATSIEIAGTAMMLRALDAGKSTPTDRRRRMEQARQEADTLCRRRFQQAMQEMVAQQEAAAAKSPGDAAIVELEARARDLRRLEAAGRLLGGQSPYDALLRKAVLSLRLRCAGLTLIERVRLTEILAGPDEALALLEAGP